MPIQLDHAGVQTELSRILECRPAALHAPSSGLSLATDLAISVGLAWASVGLAST